MTRAKAVRAAETGCSWSHSLPFAGISPWPLMGETPNQRDTGWKRDLSAGITAVTWPVLGVETRLIGLVRILPLFSLWWLLLALSSATCREIRQELRLCHRQSLLPDFHIQPWSFPPGNFSFPGFFVLRIVEVIVVSCNLC